MAFGFRFEQTELRKAVGGVKCVYVRAADVHADAELLSHDACASASALSARRRSPVRATSTEPSVESNTTP